MYQHFLAPRAHVDRICDESSVTPAELVEFSRARCISPDEALHLADADLTPRRVASLESALRTARRDVFSEDAKVSAVAQGVIAHVSRTLAQLWTLEAGTARAALDAALLRTWA